MSLISNNNSPPQHPAAGESVSQCIACKRTRKIVGRGYCGACYQRWWKRGTTEYAPVRQRNVCHVDGCEKPVVSLGLCGMHRQRLRANGHTGENDPARGARSKHPLRNQWDHLKRYRGIQRVCPEWMNDFLQFVVDVGERPSPKHRLYVIDRSKPIGPENFAWKRSFTERMQDEDIYTYRNRRQREYRAVKTELVRGHELKKNYGISRKEYDEMRERQDDKCAICGKPETKIIRGKKISLAVDHCHATGKVRGLLCADCNRGLGHFKDDPDLMMRAALYLMKGAAQA